ncbi:MAG: AMP-binding protein, partial [Lachnospiraceae bacterium]|nr:AMP-binding protein [Lachnospiraceae bacterium]
MPKRLTNLGGAPDIRAFVERKIRTLEESERSFDALFPLMFQEKENTFYEWSRRKAVERMTYGEAYEEVLRRSRVLKKKIPEGGTVGLYMENGPMWIVNFWAILRSGHCPLLMNMRLNKETLEEALGVLQAKAVVTDSETFSILTVTDESLKSAPDEEENCGQFGDTFFVMSSGTSEHVKLCAYTAEEVYSILKDSRKIVGDSPSMQKHYHGELKQLAFLPFYHIFGFVAVYLWFAFYSRTFVALHDLAPETVLSTIRRHEVTHIFAVPLFWEKVHAAAMKTIRARGEKTYEKYLKGVRIAEKLEKLPALSRGFSEKAFREVRKNLFGESISFLISGGSRLDPEALRFFNRIGYHFAEGYGMSEIGIAGVELSENPAVRNTG